MQVVYIIGYLVWSWNLAVSWSLNRSAVSISIIYLSAVSYMYLYLSALIVLLYRSETKLLLRVIANVQHLKTGFIERRNRKLNTAYEDLLH